MSDGTSNGSRPDQIPVVESPKFIEQAMPLVRFTQNIQGLGQTTLTLEARIVKSTAAAAPYLAGMEAGWTQSLERLETHLAKP
jgi:hypothetical protein